MKAPKTTVAAMTGMAVLSTLVTLGSGQALAGGKLVLVSGQSR